MTSGLAWICIAGAGRSSCRKASAQQIWLRNRICCATLKLVPLLAAPLTQHKLQRIIAALGGQSEVARLLHVHRAQITRWLAGDEPDARNRAKLEALEFVLARLLYTFKPATARRWLTGLNAHLGNRRPIDLLARNRVAEVIAAIEQDELGSYS